MSAVAPTRILALHAHPDDIEFQAAGTLALLARRGCEITIATMTPGDCGSAEYGSEEIAEIRRGEAKAAAELIGAAYVCLEFRDLAIFNDDTSRRRVVEALRRSRPDIILTSPPQDYHCDHEATSALVRDACFAVSVPNYATFQWDPAQAVEHIPHLYFVDPLGGTDREGNPTSHDLLVDITPVFETKRAMLACHASQRNWLMRQHGIDEYLQSMEAWSRRRGEQLGVGYAEAFRQYRGHPYPQDDRLGALLGEGAG